MRRELIWKIQELCTGGAKRDYLMMSLRDYFQEYCENDESSIGQLLSNVISGRDFIEDSSGVIWFIYGLGEYKEGSAKSRAEGNYIGLTINTMFETLNPDISYEDKIEFIKIFLSKRGSDAE